MNFPKVNVQDVTKNPPDHRGFFKQCWFIDNEWVLLKVNDPYRTDCVWLEYLIKEGILLGKKLPSLNTNIRYFCVERLTVSHNSKAESLDDFPGTCSKFAKPSKTLSKVPQPYQSLIKRFLETLEDIDAAVFDNKAENFGVNARGELIPFDYVMIR